MKKYFIYFYISAIILVLMGTFLDFQISEQLYGLMPTLSELLAVFGQIPGMFLIMFTSTLLIILTLSNHRLNVVLKYISVFIFVGFYFVGGALTFSTIVENAFEIGWMATEISIFGVLIGGFVLGVLLFFPCFKLSKNYVKYMPKGERERIFRIAITVLIFIFITLITVQAIKEFWGRPRYYAIIDGLATYSPWYLIHGSASSDAFKSFVSGHATSAFIAIGWMAYFYKNLNLQKMIFIIVCFWGTLNCLSRIFTGNHFLTDVTFAAIIAMTIYLICFFILKFYEKHFIKY